MRRLHRPGLIGRAVQRVPITEVLAQLGAPAPGMPPQGVAIKVWCPFSHLHPDGGREREMRLYGENTVFCFICRRRWDAVSLAAEGWGCSQLQAARRLLSGSDVGEETLRQVHQHRQSYAVAVLAEWAEHHGVDRFSEPYQRCVRAADWVSSAEHLTEWLDASKRLLGRQEGSRAPH